MFINITLLQNYRQTTLASATNYASLALDKAMPVQLPQLVVKTYDPNAAWYASRIPEREWEKYKSLLSELHQCGLSRAEMLTHLRETHNFCPFKQQLNTKMKSWGFNVYSTRKQKSTGSHLYNKVADSALYCKERSILIAANNPVSTKHLVHPHPELGPNIPSEGAVPSICHDATISTLSGNEVTTEMLHTSGVSPHLHQNRDFGTDFRNSVSTSSNNATIHEAQHHHQQVDTSLPNLHGLDSRKLTMLFENYHRMMNRYGTSIPIARFIAPFMAAAFVAEAELSQGRKHDKNSYDSWSEVSWMHLTDKAPSFLAETCRPLYRTCLDLHVLHDAQLPAEAHKWSYHRFQFADNCNRSQSASQEEAVHGDFMRTIISASVQGIAFLLGNLSLQGETTNSNNNNKAVADGSTFIMLNLAEAFERLHPLDAEEQLLQYIDVAQNSFRENSDNVWAKSSIDSRFLSPNATSVMMRSTLHSFMTLWSNGDLGVEKPAIPETLSTDRSSDIRKLDIENITGGKRKLTSSSMTSDARSFMRMAKRIKSVDWFRKQPLCDNSSCSGNKSTSRQIWGFNITTGLPSCPSEVSVATGSTFRLQVLTV